MPSIIFLGTGGDEFTVGKQIRGSGGIIINVEGYQFHIDPGPGALLRARQSSVNLRETTAVLVSHAHINHSSDVNAILSAMSRNGFDVNGVLISNSTFVNGDEESRMTPMITEFHKNCVERIIVVRPGQRIGIQSVEVQALKAFHKDPNALGFKFITPKFTLSYTGDTRYSRELIDQYKRSDILILNVVYPKGTKGKNIDNLTFDDAAKIISKTNPKLAIITHFGKAMIDADPIDQARELQKITGTQILVASEGMSVNPVSYSADAKQKTLGSYKNHSGIEKDDGGSQSKLTGSAEESGSEDEGDFPENELHEEDYSEVRLTRSEEIDNELEIEEDSGDEKDNPDKQSILFTGDLDECSKEEE